MRGCCLKGEVAQSVLVPFQRSRHALASPEVNLHMLDGFCKLTLDRVDWFVSCRESARWKRGECSSGRSEITHQLALNVAGSRKRWN